MSLAMAGGAGTACWVPPAFWAALVALWLLLQRAVTAPVPAMPFL